MPILACISLYCLPGVGCAKDDCIASTPHLHPPPPTAPPLPFSPQSHGKPIVHRVKCATDETTQEAVRRLLESLAALNRQHASNLTSAIPTLPALS